MINDYQFDSDEEGDWRAGAWSSPSIRGILYIQPKTFIRKAKDEGLSLFSSLIASTSHEEIHKILNKIRSNSASHKFDHIFYMLEGNFDYLNYDGMPNPRTLNTLFECSGFE